MIKTFFWGFVLFLALSFFGISLKAIIQSPTGQENVTFIAQLASDFWHWLLLCLTLLTYKVSNIL